MKLTACFFNYFEKCISSFLRNCNFITRTCTISPAIFKNYEISLHCHKKYHQIAIFSDKVQNLVPNVALNNHLLELVESMDKQLVESIVIIKT